MHSVHGVHAPRGRARGTGTFPERGRGRYTSPPPKWRDPPGSRPRGPRQIGQELTLEEKEKMKELAPCPFEHAYETLTCLDIDCWNSGQYKHRRKRPEECRYGGNCRSYRCLRLHNIVAWKETTKELKVQSGRYRDKEQEQEEEWNGGNAPPSTSQNVTESDSKITASVPESVTESVPNSATETIFLDTEKSENNEMPMEIDEIQKEEDAW